MSDHATRKLQPLFGDIRLEAGGDHKFDLAHLRRQGVVRLLRLLLWTAGFRQPATWHLRVEKKFACGPETRAITVVGAKPWCCYVKVKPGDNNTGHFCSLLVPAGQRGETVYEALKNCENEVNSAWFAGAEEVQVDDSKSNGASPAAAEQGRTGAPAAREANLGTFQPTVPADDLASDAPTFDTEEAEIETGSSELLGWTQDADKLRLTLLAIHELAQEGQSDSLKEFVTTLAEKLSWQGLRRRQIGGVFRGLTRRGYTVKLRRGSLPTGYALTSEGLKVIQDLLPSDAGSAPPARELAAESRATEVQPPDSAGLLAALSGIAQDYASAHRKLQDNRTRRAQLLAEIERLDVEAGELTRVVENVEVKALLRRLVQLTQPRDSAPAPEGRGR